MNTQERWLAALKEARQGGLVHIRQNVQKCCNSCIEAKDLGFHDGEFGPYCYTYGGQGSRYRWEWNYSKQDYELVYANGGRYYAGKPVEAVYWKFGGVEEAEALYNAFKSRGFHTEWDGSEFRCVEVLFDAA